MQKEITLYTEDRKLVGKFDIPKFRSEPEVVVWGQRVFKRDHQFHLDAYTECFAYVILPSTEPKELKNRAG